MWTFLGAVALILPKNASTKPHGVHASLGIDWAPILD